MLNGRGVKNLLARTCEDRRYSRRPWDEQSDPEHTGPLSLRPPGSTVPAFVVISLERRGIVHVGVTEHPTGAWVAQRMVEAVGDAPPRYLLRDRDSIYDARFRARLRGLGVRCLLSPPRAPLANAICKRLVGTLRRDCLDHIMVFGERHAERILREYLRYYQGRPHRNLHNQPPAGLALARSGDAQPHIP